MRNFIAAVIVVLSIGAGTSLAADSVNIAAAISLKDALTDASAAYNRLTGEEIQFTFGASGALLVQIKNGAPIDAFISAANEQVDAAEKAGLTVPGTRVVLASNDLVLIVPAKGESAVKAMADVAKPEVKKIAIGQRKSVPAGEYAIQTLTNLKLLDAVSGRIVNGANVRQVLDYVERGEVDAGFVYATDAQQAGLRVKVIATAPADSHDPIVYPAVLLSASKHQEAGQRFLNFLTSPEGRKLFQGRGFKTASPATQPAPTGR